MGSSPTAPPVVAVVVTCNPGPWFEESLEAFAAQDYPNLSVLFVDSASDEDPSARMAAVLPDGYVRRLGRRVGFGAAANEVLQVVDGASHYIFCHDDVAPSPDAFRLMVEEAVRSNAGVVTPKVVEWERSDRLICVGLSADRLGVLEPLLERGELDQGQHDRVRDVFVAPGGVTLVRSDLFGAMGGFSIDVDQYGEDLDLSWRAQLAGARLVTAPGARVRHLEAQRRGLRDGVVSPLARRRAAVRSETHRLRTLAACTGAARLPFVLAMAAGENVMQALVELLMGRPGDAGVSIRPLGRALGHPVRLLRMRRRAQKNRLASDARLSRRQAQGSARLRAFVLARLHDEPSAALPLSEAPTPDVLIRPRARAGARGRPGPGLADGPGVDGPLTRGSSGPGAGGGASFHLDGDRSGAWRNGGPMRHRLTDGPAGQAGDEVGQAGDEVGRAGDEVGRAGDEVGQAGVSVGGGTWRSPVCVGALLLILFLIGSRGLLGREFPAIGQIPVTSGGVGGWWRSWWSTWQVGLLGSTGVSPPGLGLLALAGRVFFGAAGVLQRLVVLLPFAVGPVGAYRAARWWGSMQGRVAALIVYALVPVPYNALAHGNWPGLLAYAGAPFALSMIGRLSNRLPFPPTTTRAILGRTVGVGVLVALVAAFVPSWLLVVPVMGAALSIGSLLAGERKGALRTFGVSLGGAVVGFVLLLPWSASVLRSRVATFGVPVGPSGQLSLGHVLRMYTGPIGSVPLGWAVLAAAALPLLIGRSWRLAWAGRLWMVALSAFGLVWAGSHGWLPTPPPEDLLCFAAAALAGSVALGVVAFELDLPGYRLGWRQLASAIAAVAVAVGGVPAMAAAGNGRWHLPSADATSVLGFLPSPSQGDYRVLWLGSPVALPLGSQYLADGVGYATSFDGEPVEADQWAPPRSGGATVMAVDLRRAALGLTTELGHLLAPYGVRYIVVPNHNAPSASDAAATPVDASILTGLAEQTDLESVTADPDYTIYANAAWAPVRSVTSPALARVMDAPEPAQSTMLGEANLAAGSRPVLTGTRTDRVTGRVPGGSTVAVSMTRSASWSLTVDGDRLAPKPAYGWAMRFDVPPGPASLATLSAGSAGGARVRQEVEIGLWVLALALLVFDRRRRLGRTPERVRREWFLPARAGRPWRSRTGSRSGLTPADADLGADEVWVDA